MGRDPPKYRDEMADRPPKLSAWHIIMSTMTVHVKVRKALRKTYRFRRTEND
jgi:hypothetical protein